MVPKLTSCRTKRLLWLLAASLALTATSLAAAFDAAARAGAAYRVAL